MSAGADLLREFWRRGVRIEVVNDRFRLSPPGVAPETLRILLREYRSEIQALLGQLPAPGQCPICGDPTGWGPVDGSTTGHCVDCATIAADRVLQRWRDLSEEGAA